MGHKPNHKQEMKLDLDEIELSYIRNTQLSCTFEVRSQLFTI